jgi:hypothetical protein
MRVVILLLALTFNLDALDRKKLLRRISALASCGASASDVITTRQAQSRYPHGIESSGLSNPDGSPQYVPLISLKVGICAVQLLLPEVIHHHGDDRAWVGANAASAAVFVKASVHNARQ